MSLKTCQYGSCLEPIGEDGVVVSLRRKTYNDSSRAGFCCAAHAAAALHRLAMLRGEQDKLEASPIPARWRVK